jgi:hypothetical protein
MWLLTCAVAGLVLVAGFFWILRVTWMPLRSYRGTLSPAPLDLATRLAAHVKFLSETIGERMVDRPESLRAVNAYARDELRRAGYDMSEHSRSSDGQKVSNLEAILTGNESPSDTVIVGAHYDRVTGTVGADDNATEAAAVLELARTLQGSKFHKTVRSVLFVNEGAAFLSNRQDGQPGLCAAAQARWCCSICDDFA